MGGVGACQPGPARDRGTFKRVMGAGDGLRAKGETRESEALSSPVESWAMERATRHKLERMNSCLLASPAQSLPALVKPS